MKKTLMVVGIALLGQTTMANAATSSIKMPKDDLVHVLGWMEDACVGSKAPYKAINEKYRALTDSFITMDAKSEYRPVVAPRSKWLPEYRNVIKDIKLEYKDDPVSGRGYTHFNLTFNKNVKYRGLPIEKYTHAFVEESEGSKKILKFPATANVKSIVPNFKSRMVDGLDGPERMGAAYKAKDKTIACYTY